MKKIISIIIVSIIAIGAVIITNQNPTNVRFGLFKHYYSVPLPFIIFGSLLVGLLLGLILFLPDVLSKRKWEKKALSYQNKESNHIAEDKSKKVKKEESFFKTKKKEEPTINTEKKAPNDPFDDPELDELLNM